MYFELPPFMFVDIFATSAYVWPLRKYNCWYTKKVPYEKCTIQEKCDELQILFFAEFFWDLYIFQNLK